MMMRFLGPAAVALALSLALAACTMNPAGSSAGATSSGAQWETGSSLSQMVFEPSRLGGGGGGGYYVRPSSSQLFGLAKASASLPEATAHEDDVQWPDRKSVEEL
jgi:hypothetical protein